MDLLDYSLWIKCNVGHYLYNETYNTCFRNEGRYQIGEDDPWWRIELLEYGSLSSRSIDPLETVKIGDYSFLFY